MINLEQIKLYLEKAPDRPEAEAIKGLLCTRRESEGRVYLTKDDLFRIAKWKLDKQIGRVYWLLEQNPINLIQETTALALSPSFNDLDYELTFRFSILISLRGVGIGLASAILALSFPEKYCVIDYRGWRQVFDEEKRIFALKDYKGYLDKVSAFAHKLGSSPQEVDLAIWAYDKERH